MENLDKELEGVPAFNIWNYDETCLVNDQVVPSVS